MEDIITHSTFKNHYILNKPMCKMEMTSLYDLTILFELPLL